MDIEQYEEYVSTNLLVFFERRVVDALAGMTHHSLLGESETNALLKQYQYNRAVLYFHCGVKYILLILSVTRIFLIQSGYSPR